MDVETSHRHGSIIDSLRVFPVPETEHDLFVHPFFEQVLYFALFRVDECPGVQISTLAEILANPDIDVNLMTPPGQFAVAMQVVEVTVAGFVGLTAGEDKQN